MIRILSIATFILSSLYVASVKDIQITKSFTLDSLGACQGISLIDGRHYAYGDAETGVVREYSWNKGSLNYQNRQWKLSINNKDVINHPTGFAHQKGLPFFMGNSVRLNPEGTQWKAVIYCIDWKGLLNSRTLDGNLIKTIDDDAAVQGTRPEYVRYKGKWYVATADYGGVRNEVRLYEPQKLATANRTSDEGVLVYKFNCGPWVQNLCWHNKSGMLVLVQNQIEGRRWRLSFIDLENSVETGTSVVRYTKDFDKSDELEGFSFTENDEQAIAVTSSRTSNGHLLKIDW
ncbi:hypothetical protein WBG78_07910 [Chryseolinea sp. T2]|uniref:hypothetical protein n=1 Tax=Chryseolinea sp. T2 TaxID=3129255 RepID=UPI003076D0F2